MYEHPPDRLEYVVRFVCGALLGIVAGLFFARDSETTSHLTLLLFMAFPALVLGAVAAWFGDRFWHGLFNLMRW